MLDAIITWCLGHRLAVIVAWLGVALAGVLVPATPMLGTPFSPPTATGKVWTHFAVGVPQAHAHPLLSASQVQAERREDHHMLARGLAEFPQELVERAHALLTSGTLYRSEKCIGVAAWLLALHQQLAGVKSARQKDALIWKAAATAPAGFAHVRSSMIGTLLEDLAAGLDSAAIKRRFDDKMAPSQYGRAQVAPSAGNIAQAEKVIAALKATGSLDRRFARQHERGLRLARRHGQSATRPVAASRIHPLPAGLGAAVTARAAAIRLTPFPPA